MSSRRDLVTSACTVTRNEFLAALHDDIRRAVGVPFEWAVRDGVTDRQSARRSRDPRFRPRVLQAYEQRCAVCDSDVRIGDNLFGLDAAHIKWHAAGGPDDVRNGLALCNIHHKALDRGALGLTAGDEGYAVVISSDLHGRSDAVRWLLDYHGRPLRRPQSRSFEPQRDFVDWHRREVFREPARELRP